jgi:hypothetical protein
VEVGAAGDNTDDTIDRCVGVRLRGFLVNDAQDLACARSGTGGSGRAGRPKKRDLE